MCIRDRNKGEIQPGTPGGCPVCESRRLPCQAPGRSGQHPKGTATGAGKTSQRNRRAESTADRGAGGFEEAAGYPLLGTERNNLRLSNTYQNFCIKHQCLIRKEFIHFC